jgi:hypothetical protein
MEVLTPESPRWNEFADALWQSMAIPGEPVRWRCDGDGSGDSNPELVHRHAKKVMADMGNVDIPASIAFFESRGGYCDCEILFNVDREPTASQPAA